MNTATVAETPNTAGRAAWVCLAIAWLTFIVPIPGIGLFIGWPLNLVAFILAIVAMSKSGAGAGLWQLIASLVASPVVYFIGLAVFAGTAAGIGEATRQASAPAAIEAPAAPVAAVEPIAVDAASLHAAYDANEIAADRQFKGQPLTVTGTVSGISSDFTDDPVIELRVSDWESVHARGLPADIAAGIRKGQSVTLACTGGGEIVGTPMLDDCTL